MSNIVLIGFMGSGKSTIGRELALNCDKFLLDTDSLIEQNMGREINDIFYSVGEIGFRKIEAQLIAWLQANVKNAIIATGGGMPIYNDVRCLGKVFWLDVGFESIMQRLNANERAKRPLFSDEAKALALYSERKAIYEKVAHFVVSGNALSSEVAKKILSYASEIESSANI